MKKGGYRLFLKYEDVGHTGRAIYDKKVSTELTL